MRLILFAFSLLDGALGHAVNALLGLGIPGWDRSVPGLGLLATVAVVTLAREHVDDRRGGADNLVGPGTMAVQQGRLRLTEQRMGQMRGWLFSRRCRRVRRPRPQ